MDNDFCRKRYPSFAVMNGIAPIGTSAYFYHNFLYLKEMSMRAQYHIRSLTPVAGDWFVVSNSDGDRWFIERVVAWALIEARDKIDHVMAITSNGMTHENDYGDTYFVFGEDVSHFGVCWKEVYDKTPPSPHLVRELTEHFKI